MRAGLENATKARAQFPPPAKHSPARRNLYSSKKLPAAKLPFKKKRGATAAPRRCPFRPPVRYPPRPCAVPLRAAQDAEALLSAQRQMRAELERLRELLRAVDREAERCERRCVPHARACACVICAGGHANACVRSPCAFVRGPVSVSLSAVVVAVSGAPRQRIAHSVAHIPSHHIPSPHRCAHAEPRIQSAVSKLKAEVKAALARVCAPSPGGTVPLTCQPLRPRARAT